jgi:hypothetical protein
MLPAAGCSRKNEQSATALMLASARTLRVACGHLFAVGHLHFVSVRSAPLAIFRRWRATLRILDFHLVRSKNRLRAADDKVEENPE